MIQTLIDYAMRFVGVPYRWGGSNPMQGYDCSGLVQEILAAAGVKPKGDFTAQALYNHFKIMGGASDSLAGAIAFFGEGPTKVTHVAFCLNSIQMIEAGGGGSSTRTISDAIAQNAFVRVRPIAARRDLVAILLPKYPTIERG